MGSSPVGLSTCGKNATENPLQFLFFCHFCPTVPLFLLLLFLVVIQKVLASGARTTWVPTPAWEVGNLQVASGQPSMWRWYHWACVGGGNWVYKHIWRFPKMGGTQQPLVFLPKMSSLGCFGGYHHLRKHPYLVGGFNPFRKIWSSNWIISSNFGVKIQKIWNHHLVFLASTQIIPDT